jgi:hypothetical protein
LLLQLEAVQFERSLKSLPNSLNLSQLSFNPAFKPSHRFVPPPSLLLLLTIGTARAALFRRYYGTPSTAMQLAHAIESNFQRAFTRSDTLFRRSAEALTGKHQRGWNGYTADFKYQHVYGDAVERGAVRFGFDHHNWHPR